MASNRAGACASAAYTAATAARASSGVAADVRAFRSAEASSANPSTATADTMASLFAKWL
jgi:hypothetical protein